MAARHIVAEQACSFLSASTDPFHAVFSSIQKLKAAGFLSLRSNNKAIVPGGKYYYDLHHSTLVAFTVGNQFNPTRSRFKIIGGHTDSPVLKVKPRSKIPSSHGVTRLGVETYGGGLWHTWLDRDLSLSGKVLVRNQSGDIQHRLLQLRDPIARVSSLCIHLQSAEERKALELNKERHTIPILATSDGMSVAEEAARQLNEHDTWIRGQDPMLIQRIAQELDVDPSQIADWDLNLYDTQAPTIGGINKDFVYSARLDNLATVFCAISALVDHSQKETIESEADISMVVCFDHEEVGSVSSHGAGSPVLEDAVRRISSALFRDTSSTFDLMNPYEFYSDLVQRSFCLSMDQAHAIHPNYASKHEAQHAPLLNQGIVVKTNSNQRYTTNSLTGFLVRELARTCDIPLQEFAGTFPNRVCAAMLLFY